MAHELAGPLFFVLAFLVLGVTALRFGADSRRDGDGRGNW